MKILHINTYDRAGGAEQFAYDMTHIGFENASLAVKRKKTDSPKVYELPRKPLSRLFEYTDKTLLKAVNRTLFSDLSILHNIHGTYAALSRSADYLKADIIHLHNLHYDFFDLRSLIKISHEKPVVWTLHDMWCMTGGEAYTFENNNYQQGLGATPYQQFHPLNNPLIDRRQEYLEKKKQIYAQLGERFVFVPPCHWLSNCLKSAYVYHPAMDIRVINYGIDLSVFRNLRQRNWSKPRILFFSFQNPFKGTHLFKQIANQVEKEFDLYLVGQPFDFKGNMTVLDRIHDRERLNQLYNEVDIMIFPSEAENFPITVMEAKAAGVCVIGATTGGIVEQLDRGAGILFERSNEKDLLAKINEALAMPLSQIRTIGEEACRRAHEAYSKQLTFNKYAQLYDELLKK